MMRQSILAPAGPAATQITTMTWIMIVASTVIAIIVLLVLLRVITRKPDSQSPSESTALKWVVLAGAAAPAVIVSALFVYSVLLLGAQAPSRHPGEVQITLVGKQWWWLVQYDAATPALRVTSANEIHIPVGEPVHIRLESSDVIHSLWVPELQGKVDLIPGRTNLIWLQADRPGVYRAQCAEYCGLQHAHMALYVIAHERGEFERWLEGARAPAQVSGAQAAGRAVFMQHGCAVCHTIRGTEAHGTIGPDLTHIAARRSLAAGTLPNTRGHLAGWIANPQVIKPGNLMPRVPLNRQDFTVLLDFLQTLH